MNRKMRRMLEKKGGMIADMLKDAETGELFDDMDNSSVMQLIKDSNFKSVMKLMRKHKKDEGTIVCPECGEETEYKGLISKCDKCGKYHLIKENLSEEELEESNLEQVVEIMNGANLDKNKEDPQ